MARRLGSIARLAPVLLVAACASGSGGGTSEATPQTATGVDTGLAAIEVVHNWASNSSVLTIMIEPQSGGVRRSLGQIEPGQTRTFSYDALPGNYRLMVQGVNCGGSTPGCSPTFRLSNREIARWDMQLNRVTPRNK